VTTQGLLTGYNKYITNKATHMRKIEAQMNRAIRTGNNFSSSNTSVSHDDNGAQVFLHGNHIATVTDSTVVLFDGGWQSNTTKSRLNALCYEFATGFGVFQKNWEWFVGDYQNKTVKDFENGIEVNFNGCFA
tara:strand:+ start:765 stop:1160 length:396 start_codon:yes stop_codon:yes gene_type:complete